MTLMEQRWQADEPYGERKAPAERERRFGWRPLLAVTIAGAWLGAAASAYALPVCDATTGNISACCKITHSTAYQFTQTVTATAGGDCIRITVPYVYLDLGVYHLDGVSSTSPVGTGIHVLPAARASIVVNGAGIEYFATGIRNGAAKGIFYNLAIGNNGGNGVINNGPKALFWAVNSMENGRSGIVNNASGALFINFQAFNNDGNGIVLESPPAPAPPTTNVHASQFEANRNSRNGVVLRRAVGDEVGDFYVFNNNLDGVLVRGGGRNLLNTFIAGNEGTSTGNAEHGLEIKSSNGNFMFGFGASENGQSGVRIASSTRNSIVSFAAYSNAGSGLWLDSAARNTVSGGRLCGNTTSGVYVGCSPTTLPSATSCGTAPHSNGNVLLNNDPQSNAVGIGIDKGNHGTQVMFSDAVDLGTTPCGGANSTYDLEDDNANCDSNIWFHNRFNDDHVSPLSCIH